jgi:hypothetical protein
MAQPRPPPGPPGNQRNPYAQRPYYDSQSNGPEAQYPAMRSTTALIGAQESQTSLAQFPSYGTYGGMMPRSHFVERPLTDPYVESDGPPGRPNFQPPNPFGQQYAQSTFSSTAPETAIAESTFGAASKHPYPAWTNDKNVPLSMEEIEGTPI